MIDSINANVTNWGKSNISKAGKVVLIDSVIMATPIYYLSVCPIPNSVLLECLKSLGNSFGLLVAMEVASRWLIGIPLQLVRLRGEWALEIL